MNIKNFNLNRLWTSSAGLWWYLASLWTLILYLAIIYDFLNNHVLENLLGPLAAIYVGILAIYVSDKELERWHESHKSRHPGELFVVGWTILILLIVACNFFLSKSYRLPSEIISTYIAVLSILAITRRSKSLYQKKRGQN